MPRIADPKLEERILKAARKLWIKGGEQALTMREVAKAARTTTPTVYQRFRSRRAILQALCLQTRQKLFLLLKESTSAREACELYLSFAEKHPREYELLVVGWVEAPSKTQQWPSFTLLKERMSQRFGGRPEDHQRVALAMWSLLHGTAMLIIFGKKRWALKPALRDACMHAIEALGMPPMSAEARSHQN